MMAYGFTSGTIDAYNAGYSVGQALGIGVASGTAAYLGAQVGGAFGSWVGGANESAAALGSSIFGGMGAGAAGGATGAALTGGDVGEAAWQGAAIGGTAALFMHGLMYRGPPAAESDAAAQEALTVDLNDDPPIEVYERGKDILNTGKGIGPRVHPVARNTGTDRFTELQNVNGKISILEGDLSQMSSATRNYMGTNPKPNPRLGWNASQSRYDKAINDFTATYGNGNTNYSYTSRNCRSYINYLRRNSEIE